MSFNAERWLNEVAHRIPRSRYGQQLAHALAVHASEDGTISISNTRIAHIAGLGGADGHVGRRTLIDAGLLVRTTPPPGVPPRRGYYILTTNATTDAKESASHDHHHHAA